MTYRQGTLMNLKVPVPQRKLAGGSAQENLWTAIRNLKSFTPAELAFAATTDTLKISETVAMRYLRRLRDAGYLTCVRDAVTKADAWRLVPRMNTGPQPPMMMQVTLLFDRNSKMILDGPHSEEVVL